VAGVELADVLRRHLERLRECRVRAAVRRVAVARGVDVGPALVQRGVDQEAGGVGGAGLGAVRRAVVFQVVDEFRGWVLGRVQDFAVQAEEDHVAGAEQAEVHAERVRPEGVGVFWVAHGDVPADAEDVVLTRPMAEDGRHVLKLPLAVVGEGHECRDRGDGWGPRGGVVAYGADGVDVAHAVDVFGLGVSLGRGFFIFDGVRRSDIALEWQHGRCRFGGSTHRSDLC